MATLFPRPRAARSSTIRRMASGVAGRGHRVWRRPGVRHLVEGLGRYNDRMGTQFAGAITYFSFLALVPILMSPSRSPVSCWPPVRPY